jgi:hypothetical protein
MIQPSDVARVEEVRAVARGERMMAVGNGSARPTAAATAIRREAAPEEKGTAGDPAGCSIRLFPILKIPRSVVARSAPPFREHGFAALSSYRRLSQNL